MKGLKSGGINKRISLYVLPPLGGERDKIPLDIMRFTALVAGNNKCMRRVNYVYQIKVVSWND